MHSAPYSDAAGGPVHPAGTPLRFDDQEERDATDIGGRYYHVEADAAHGGPLHRYEPDLVALYELLVRRDDVVLDIGADLGYAAILLGNRTRHVHGFEASPATFSLLARNIDLARLDNITLHNVGFAAEAGWIEPGPGRPERLRLVHGDRFLAQTGISQVDFVRIAVPGFDTAVLESLLGTLTRSGATVLMELDPWHRAPQRPHEIENFFDCLRSIFPHLYAAESDDLRNLHDGRDGRHVLRQHALGAFRFPILLGAFDPARLEQVWQYYGHARH